MTVAVLPFHVFSGRDDDRRLADRLADGITAELARTQRWAWPRTPAPASIATRNARSREIGRALGVRVVMEGTAHVDGPMVRLEVRLVDAGLGRKLWVEDFIAESDVSTAWSARSHRRRPKFLLERYRPDSTARTEFPRRAKTWPRAHSV